jgi:exopolyphosphatase/guanosine-5'-triphosphate,3'-diphosphate pyrophosphatase
MMDLFEQVKGRWRLPEYRSRKFISWASRLHEIGLSIAYSGNHRHAAYLVRHSEMAGFSREQQAMLAAILENQRRRLEPKRLEKLAPERRQLALQLSLLLRLAILLNRARGAEPAPKVEVIEATDKRLALLFPGGWLDTHPLTRADLDEEAEYLKKVHVELSYH